MINFFATIARQISIGFTALAAGCLIVSAGPAMAVNPPVVSANLMKYGDGTRFIVGGAAQYMVAFYSNGSGGPDTTLATSCNNAYNARDTIFARMKSLGFNTVRLPVGVDPYNTDYYGYGGKAGYQTRVANIVASANNQGLYVIIGWWDSLGAGANWPTTYTNSFQMMVDIHAKLGANPMVMYEPWNEPNNVSWAQWDTVMNDTIREWRQTIGYHGILFLDTKDWSWSFSAADAQNQQAMDASYIGTSNIVFANHRYANANVHFTGADETAWESAVGNQVGTFPIMGTEYGYFNNQGAPQPAWNTELLDYLAGTKVAQGFNGYCDFVWSWVDGNNMTNSDLVTLNQHGQIAYDHFIHPVLGSGVNGPVKINCAGPAVSPFVADAGFSGGATATNWTGAIDTSGVTSPAPQAVYQSERYENPAITYTIGGLTANATYIVRLHFCENYLTGAGLRVFNVAINGTTVLTNYDIFAAAGAAHKANIQQFNAAANGSGQEVITFTNVTNFALINGIEVNTASGSAPSAPTGLTATAGNAQVLLSWAASSGATSYNALRSTVSGSRYASVATGIGTTSYTNTGLTNGTTYYFVVTATNSAGTSGNSNQASATPTASGGGNTHSGTWAAKAVLASSPGYTNLSEVRSCTSNSTYIASIWVKGGGSVMLDVKNGNWGTDITTVQCNATSTWTQFTTAAFNTGSNTQLTYVLQDQYGGVGTMYLDDAFLGVSAGTNILGNADFESGNTVWGVGAAFSIVQPGGGSVPSVPTGLTATPGNTQVALSWTASSGATSYNVLRSTVSGSGYASVATGIATTSYTNTGLTDGTTYYFVLTATNTYGSSGNSSQVSGIPVDPNVHAGTWDMKAVLTTTPSYTNAWETVGCAANSTYAGSIWIKGSGSVMLDVKNGNWGTDIMTVQCSATSTWTKVSTASFSTGSNTQLTFVLQDQYGGTAGTCYLDDAFLGVANGANILVNPGFESGNVNWAPSGVFTIVQNP